MNEAALAEEEGAASAEDIDTAMILGTNYPNGPLAWSEHIGLKLVGKFLRTLNQAAADKRFTAAKRFLI